MSAKHTRSGFARLTSLTALVADNCRAAMPMDYAGLIARNSGGLENEGTPAP